VGQRGPNARPVKKRYVNTLAAKRGPGRPPKLETGLSGDRVERNIAWIEKLPVTSGILAGTNFKVRSFQREIIENIYRTDESGKRLVRQVVISMPRKNGKTGLTAVLALLHFCGPESIPRGQVYSAAAERKQAGLIYEEMKAIIERVPELRRRVIIRDFTKQLEDAETGTVFFALSAESTTKHGYSASCWIYDELAQARDRKLYDVLSTSVGAHAEPLGIVISTQSHDPGHIMSELVDYGIRVRDGIDVDPSFYAAIYAAPLEADPWAEETWYECNPALGDFRSLEDMQISARQAKRMPTREASFRLLYLNQRVSDEATLITREEWLRCQSSGGTLKDGEEIYLGLDLSATTDLTALVAVSANDGDRLKAWFWKPGDEIQEHTARDRAPYDEWVKQGWIEAPKGRAVDYGYVARRIAEIGEEYCILGIAYDRWHIKNFIRELTIIGLESYVDDSKSQGVVDGLRLVPWGQGYADMAPAVSALEISVLEGRLKHDGNPVLKMCMANAMVDMDAAGNRKLDKSATRFRIDGAQAAAMVMGLKYRESGELEKDYDVFFVG
jgi:phage terminase large subunit-like protein